LSEKISVILTHSQLFHSIWWAVARWKASS